MVDLKFRYRDLFRGGRLIYKFLYEQLEDLQKQINDLSVSGGGEVPDPVIVKENVDLTAQALGSNFGAASNFKGVGVVINSSGTYLVVSDGSAFKYITMDDLS